VDPLQDLGTVEDEGAWPCPNCGGTKGWWRDRKTTCVDCGVPRNLGEEQHMHEIPEQVQAVDLLQDFQDTVMVGRVASRVASADFNKRYERLVQDLQAMRDLYNMDPQRIAQQAIRTLEIRTKHAKER
jgi:hypothetical protein